MNKSPTPLSIIVPAYNEQAHIERCLRSLKGGDSLGVEVVVVDNNSTDDTAKIAEKLAQRVVQCREQGISAARNHGAAVARGEWLGFVDADALPGPRWLEAARRLVEGTRYDAVSGWNCFEAPTLPTRLFFNSYNVVFFTGMLLLMAFGRKIVVGNNMIIRRSVFEKVGGFPRYVAEDIKLGACLQEIGAKTGFSLEMPIVYSSRRLRHKGFWRTMILWTSSVVRNIPDRDYGIDYATHKRETGLGKTQ